MEKPAPKPNADSQIFWDGCNRKEFLYQFCTRCERAQFYPRVLCARCHAKNLEWRRSKGEGTIYSYTEIHRAPAPAFQSKEPYVLALIDMDEGFRFMANVLGSEANAVRIGTRVRAIFESRGDQMIPQVTPLG